MHRSFDERETFRGNGLLYKDTEMKQKECEGPDTIAMYNRRIVLPASLLRIVMRPHPRLLTNHLGTNCEHHLLATLVSTEPVPQERGNAKLQACATRMAEPALHLGSCAVPRILHDAQCSASRPIGIARTPKCIECVLQSWLMRTIRSTRGYWAMRWLKKLPLGT